MNDFLSSMKSLVLYQHSTKEKRSDKSKSNDVSEDEIQLEMIKFKKAISSSPTPTKIQNLDFKDYYSSSINKIDSPTINAGANIKDTLAKESSLSTLSSKASSQSIGATNSSIVSGGGSSNLSNYSSTFSFSAGVSIPVIKQFGLIKMTGTEGSLKNGYTIGKDAKQRASASIEYVARDENGKSIADLKDKNGNTISKLEAKQEIQNIAAERRLVLSPNPKLNISDEQLDKVVRETMSSYSESFGKDFNYFYAIHNNTSTPHAHIIMTSTHPDGDGIKMYKDELFELKMNFEDNLKELVKDSGINIKDESTLPAAKQIANFIGVIPDTNIFSQNKFLAQKIAKKFDLEFDQKQIGNNPEKLENWFLKNDNSFKEYFISATNKDAFLFQDYIKVAQDLSEKYDLGLNKNTTSNIKEFKSWLDDKQEIFLAHKVAQDKNIILQKEDVSDKNKLYKWFKENEVEVKEWNEKNKYSPSKQMSSLAQKYSEMVDIKPDNILESRKDAREFVKNYTKNPLMYAGDSRKSLYEVLGVKKEQYKKEFSQKYISKKSFDTEIKRLDTLQKRLSQSQQITEGSLKKYNLDTSICSIDSKTIQIDGIKFLTSENTKELLTNKINFHVENLTKGHKDEYSKNYIKKAAALNYIISKSDNISISALENIGLNKEKDLKDFKIEKVDTELKIINFKNTDLNNNLQDIKIAEEINKNKPLAHQVTQLSKIEKDFKINTENVSYKDANQFIYENKHFNSYNKKEINKIIKDIQNKNVSLKGDDLFLNKYIDSINKNLGNLQEKLEIGKNTLSLDEIKSTGIDTKNLEIYQGSIKTNIILNDEENLRKLDYLIKDYSKEKEYEDFTNQIKNSEISKLNLNNALAKVTNKVLPIDFKTNILKNIKFEPKEIHQELIKINSLKNLSNSMNSAKNNFEVNETVSNAIFNSPKYFENIASRLHNEHGIEIKTAKDLSDNFNKIGQENPIRNELLNYLKDIQQSNNSLKNDDEYINKYIDNKNQKIENLIYKLDNKKEIDIESIKATGIDTKNLETYEKIYEAPFIINNEENLIKLENLNSYFTEKEYENIKNSLEKGTLKNSNLDYLLSNATNKKDISSLPINLKAKFATENKEFSQSIVKVSSLNSLLNDKNQINETVSNAIFNSPKYFENIASRLHNEHGIEIKTAKDLSDNFNKIGQSSELRNLITKIIQHKINEFREVNNLQNNTDFNKYTEKMNIDNQSKIPLDINQKELNSLNNFLVKNEGNFPIFESDLKKIGANTISFNDKESITIKVEVVAINIENKPLVLNALGTMAVNSENKIENTKINELDKTKIDNLNEEEKSKSKFKEATNEYIKTAVNTKETINYVSAIIENRTLKGMSYMIEKDFIKDVPKNFLEARNIDTTDFEIKLKDKEVETVSMSSKENLEQFKMFLTNNSLQNIINPKIELSTIQNEINLDYKIETNNFITQNQELTSSNINEFNTLLSFSIDDKNIEMMDTLYKLDISSKNDAELLELKFVSYAEALNISKDDVYAKMLEKYFDIRGNDLNAIDNLEKTFDTLFEISNIVNEKIYLTPEDIKHQLYVENLSELTASEYEQYMWKHFDMDNENVTEENMKAYFEATQNFTDESLKLNDFISENLEIKELENQIENSLENGNFNKAQELMQDERLESTMRNSFEYLYESMLSDENILDEVYEKIVDGVNLEEKIYEAFKEDNFLNEMKKIDIEEKLMDEIFEEMQQEELEEHELILGGK